MFYNMKKIYIILPLMFLLFISFITATTTTYNYSDGWYLYDDFNSYNTSIWELQGVSYISNGRVITGYSGGKSGIILKNDLFRGNPQLEFNITVEIQATTSNQRNAKSYSQLLNNKNELSTGDFINSMINNHGTSVIGRYRLQETLNGISNVSGDSIVSNKGIYSANTIFETRKINNPNGTYKIEQWYKPSNQGLQLINTIEGSHDYEDFPDELWYFGWECYGGNDFGIYLNAITISTKSSSYNPPTPELESEIYTSNDLPKATMDVFVKVFIVISIFIPIIILSLLIFQIPIIKNFK